MEKTDIVIIDMYVRGCFYRATILREAASRGPSALADMFVSLAVKQKHAVYARCWY